MPASHEDPDMIRLPACLVAAALLAGLMAAPAAAQERTADGLTILKSFGEFEDPVYPDGFARFDYVNPDAPRGGHVVLAATGTFERLDTITQGAPWAAGIGLTTDSLMTGSGDELAAYYPLIATQVAVPDDLSWLGLAPTEMNRAEAGLIHVYLLLDASSSMAGEPMEEAREAARAFLARCDFTRTRVGLISFSDQVVLQAEATDNPRRLSAALLRIEALALSAGDTSEAAVTRQLRTAVDLVVQIERIASSRKVVAIEELEDGEVVP